MEFSGFKEHINDEISRIRRDGATMWFFVPYLWPCFVGEFPDIGLKHGPYIWMIYIYIYILFGYIYIYGIYIYIYIRFGCSGDPRREPFCSAITLAIA